MNGLTLNTQATVRLTAREWQIYSLDNDARADVAARHAMCVDWLNIMASQALSCSDPDRAFEIFWAAQEKFADFGAADTEPSSVFARMHREVFGESC